MKHLLRTLTLVAGLAAVTAFSADAKKNKDLVETYPALAPYFSTPVEAAVQPDELGFIRRWVLLEPISKPNRTNTVFVDSYIRQNLDTGWNKGDFEVPADGAKVTMIVEEQAPVDMTAGRPRNFSEEPETKQVKKKLTWHALDSKLFNVKLYRYAVGTETGRYGAIFRAVTVIDVPEDMENVRLAVGSNSASMWWIDGEEALILSGDRRMVMDDGADRQFGAGHFGRYIEDDGVEKMSFHWEADLDRSGRSVLAIRPVIWVNDWPVGGELFKDGVYEINSVRRGYALELAVDFTRMQMERRAFFRMDPDEPVKSLEVQKLEDVEGTWPEGDVDARIGDWMNRPHQRWSITAVPEAGGYLGGQYYKICIEGTDRVLTATEGADLKVVNGYTGAPEQLWRIEQLTDGSYRIMPKAVPGCDCQYVLTSIADSTPTLAKWDFSSDNCKWNFILK